MSSDTASAKDVRAAASPEPGPSHGTAPELQCEYEPIRLEDLLSGLPPIHDDDEFARLSATALEPALLLAEIGQPTPAGQGGWAADAEPPAPKPEEDGAPGPGPVAASATASAVVDAMCAADPGAMMDTLAVIAEAPEAADDDVLELTEDHLAAQPEPAAEPAADEMPAPTEEPTAAEPEADPAAGVEAGTDILAARIEAILAAHGADGSVPAKGETALPEDRDALALLLSEPPPASDFAALDALYACWPRATHHSDSRALLAVAQNLSRNFGLPGKLPMASSKAWRMLSPEIFEAELAQRLAGVGAFIADWQKTQRTFLILEFNEVELIEYLFEALHPGHHTDLLAGVMNFKVLSNRRMGLLRRIPTRVRKQIQPLLPDRRNEAMVALAHARALLDKIADPAGFAPIVDTATKMAEEVEKTMKAIAATGAPAMPPPGGSGTPLGRMG